MVVFVEGNVCSRLDHRSGQKNCIFARDADPLLTGKKPGNKAKQNKEGKKDKRSHDYLKRNVCPRLDHRSEQKNCIFAMQILC